MFTDREWSLKCIAADHCGILYVILTVSDVQYLFTNSTKTTMVTVSPCRSSDSHAIGKKFRFGKIPTARVVV